MAEQPLVEVARTDPEEAARAVVSANTTGPQVAAVDRPTDRSFVAAHLRGGLRDRQVLNREPLFGLGHQVQLQLLVTHVVTSFDAYVAGVANNPTVGLTPPPSLSREQPTTPPWIASGRTAPDQYRRGFLPRYGTGESGAKGPQNDED